MTQWRDCPAFPGYQISEDGKVSDIGGPISGKVRKRDGYLTYRLKRDGKRYFMRAYMLVVEAFVGPKPFAGAEVCHNDGTKDNDHFSNLRWDTRKANSQDRAKHGRTPTGLNNPRAKLTPHDVRGIRWLLGNDYSQRKIAPMFDISRAQIQRIATGKHWAA